jgi:DNA-binding LacI/PurR family transcriptional regulator
MSSRITMQDIARAAGVHQTTVSLALRNDPRLPAATRRRLQALAERMGYKPDPMLSALNAYRSARRAAVTPVTMAFLANFADRSELEISYPHVQFLAGAQAQAGQHGYHLEVFFVGHDEEAGAAAQRIGRILRARGIAGVILGAFADGMAGFTLPWEEFSVVQIETRQLGLSLHTVSNHQFLITRECVCRLAALGYRRIGLAVGAREEHYLQNAFTGGYHVGMTGVGLPLLPPHLFDHFRTEEIAPGLDAWVREHAIDVVVANWDNVPAALRMHGWRVPRRLAVASLDLAPGPGPNAGMRQNHAIVGARAVEQLALLMKTNQRGLVATPNLTLIEGEWVDGSDVPPVRAVRRPRARASASTKSRPA